LGSLLPGVLTKFKALDTAMKFSVIGIIALAVGGLVYAFGELSNAEEEVSEATENYNKKLEQQQKLIADLWVEVLNLSRAKNIYNDTIENTLKTQKQYLENFYDLTSLLNTYSKLQDISNLSLEDQTKYLEENKDAIDIKKLSDEEL
jgi:cell division protein FtsL